MVVGSLVAAGTWLALSDDDPSPISVTADRDALAAATPVVSWQTPASEFDLASIQLDCETGYVSVTQPDYAPLDQIEKSSAAKSAPPATPEELAAKFGASSANFPDTKPGQANPRAARFQYNNADRGSSDKVRVDMADADGKRKGVVIAKKHQRLGWYTEVTATCSPSKPSP